MSQYTTDTLWVGMDVHQDSITAAVLFGNDPEPRVEHLAGDLNAVLRMFRRLNKQGTPRSCYEASGAGFASSGPYRDKVEALCWPCAFRTKQQQHAATGVDYQVRITRVKKDPG